MRKLTVTGKCLVYWNGNRQIANGLSLINFMGQSLVLKEIPNKILGDNQLILFSKDNFMNAIIAISK